MTERIPPTAAHYIYLDIYIYIYISAVGNQVIFAAKIMKVFFSLTNFLFRACNIKQLSRDSVRV